MNPKCKGRQSVKTTAGLQAYDTRAKQYDAPRCVHAQERQSGRFYSSVIDVLK